MPGQFEGKYKFVIYCKVHSHAYFMNGGYFYVYLNMYMSASMLPDADPNSFLTQ